MRLWPVGRGWGDTARFPGLTVKKSTQAANAALGYFETQ